MSHPAHPAPTLRQFTGITEEPCTPTLAPPTRGDGPTPLTIRQWARAHGYPVAERGRFPTEVMSAYTAAH
jgi:hypothetical protein